MHFDVTNLCCVRRTLRRSSCRSARSRERCCCGSSHAGSCSASGGRCMRASSRRTTWRPASSAPASRGSPHRNPLPTPLQPCPTASASPSPCRTSALETDRPRLPWGRMRHMHLRRYVNLAHRARSCQQRRTARPRGSDPVCGGSRRKARPSRCWDRGPRSSMHRRSEPPLHAEITMHFLVRFLCCSVPTARCMKVSAARPSSHGRYNPCLRSAGHT